MFNLNIRFILLLAWYYGFRTIKRGISYVIYSLTSPLTLLFILLMVNPTFIRLAVAGGFLALVASVALSSAGDAAFLRLELKIQDLYVASTVTQYDYVAGLSLSYLIFSIPGIILYSIIGSLLSIFTLFRAFILILVMMMLIIATSSISYLISGLIKHVRNVWGIAGILSIIMTVLPPTFYPYNLLPNYALYVLMISPVTSASIIVQNAFGFVTPFYLPAIPVLIVETLVYAVMALTLTKWRER